MTRGTPGTAGADLVILLGSAVWPHYPGLDRESFRHSADGFRRYLTENLNIPDGNLLDLFGDQRPPTSLTEAIGSFLTAHAKDEASTLILYYVGHGQMVDSYRLLIGGTKKDQLLGTSLGLDELDEVLRRFRPSLSQLIILDACLAASAADEFRHPRAGKGLAILAASSRDDFAMAPDETRPTRFTEAMLKVLIDGVPSYPELLSAADLRDLIELDLRVSGDLVRPEIHDPEQRQGRISELRLFPNRAHIPALPPPGSAPATHPWCLMLSSHESPDASLRIAVREMEIKYADDIGEEFGWRMDVNPDIVSTTDVLGSPASLLSAVRRLCRVDLALVDLTGFDPAAVLLLGVRAVVRRGVTVCSSAKPTWAATAPFHLREVRVNSHDPRSSAGGAPEDVLARRVMSGLREFRAAPHGYLDLPPFDAIRTLPPSPSGPRSRKLEDGEVLVLCSFSDDYSTKIWTQLHQRLAARVRPNMHRAVPGHPRPDPQVSRSLDVDSPRIVSGALYEAIRFTEFCVVDLTEWRPNVLFELGIRLAANPIPPVVIMSAKAELAPEGNAARTQQEELLRLFDPVRYDPADPGPAADEMVDRHRRLRTAADDRPLGTDVSLATHNDVYAEAWRYIEHTAEPVAPGPVERLRDMARLMLVDQTTGVRPTIYPTSHFLSGVAEANGVELLVAAWLYLVHRVGVEGITLDPQARALADAVGSVLLDRLSASTSEADTRLANEIFEVWDELQERGK